MIKPVITKTTFSLEELLVICFLNNWTLELFEDEE